MEISTESQARQRLIERIRLVKAELIIQGSLRYQGIDDPIASYLGIHVGEARLPFSEGNYLPANPPALPYPTIIIDPRKGDTERINFTFFHEVSHHLIREDDDLYSFLNEYTLNENFQTALESFCNLGASEFLVPSQEVRNLIEQQGFRITLVEEMDHKYLASNPAIAIQLAQCASHPCFVLVCDYGVVPDKIDSQASLLETWQPTAPQLYVLYATRSPSITKYSIARFTKIPQGHLLAHCYQNQIAVRGIAQIPFRSQTVWECDCEAFYYKGKIYAAFHIQPPPPSLSLQPRLF